MTTSILDADGFIHRAAHVAPNDAGNLAARMVAKAIAATGADRAILAFSCPRTECFRREVDPAYKANRTDPEPVIAAALTAARDALHRGFPICRTLPSLEADDVIGLLMTCPTMSGERIVVADDHDLLQLAGRHYRPTKGEWVTVSPAEAELRFLTAVLTGDRGDGVEGLHGIGPVKAAKILADGGASWQAVVGAYAARGFTEADAVRTARLVRVARWEEWDQAAGRVRLWEPGSRLMAA